MEAIYHHNLSKPAPCNQISLPVAVESASIQLKLPVDLPTLPNLSTDDEIFAYLWSRDWKIVCI